MTTPITFDHFDGIPDLVYLIFPDVSKPARPVDPKYIKRKRPIAEFTQALDYTEAVSVLSRPGHCAYEFFRGERLVKPYFDRDFHIKKLKDPMRDRVAPEYVEKHRQEFHRMMQRIVDRMREVAGPEHVVSYYIAERHGFPPVKNEGSQGCYKLSFRGYVSGVRMQFSDVKLILDELDADDSYFDASVYSKSDNLMAAINGQKSLTDERILLPSGEHHLSNYIIQVTEPQWPLIQWPVSAPAKVELVKTAAHSSGEVDDAYVRALISCINPMNRAKQYRSWQNLAWAMKDAGRLVGDPDMYFLDFVAISRQVPKYAKVPEHECRAEAWDKDQVDICGHGGSTLTFGSLVYWARADDPEAAQTAHAEYTERKHARRRDEQVQAVQKAIDERFGEGSATVTRIDEMKAHIQFMGDTGHADLLSLEVYKGQSFYGMLKENIRITEPLSGVCKDIDPESSFIFNRNTQRLAELQEVRGDAHGMTKIKMFHDTSGACNAAKVELGSKTVSVTHKTKLGYLKKVCESAARQTAHDIFLVNNGTINVFNINVVQQQPQLEPMSEEDLIQLVICAKHPMVDRIVCVPSEDKHKSSYYVCDPETNIWRVHSPQYVERLVIEMLRPHLPKLTDADQRFVKSTHGGANLLKMFGRSCLDETFKATLNANLDLFAVNNGVFEFKNGSWKFRPIIPCDRIQFTAGWSYDPVEAKRHRIDVERFLEQIFPIADERQRVVGYTANLISGRRFIAKFLALTDRRSGRNGKSTFKKFLQAFFGDYFVSNNKLVTRATIARGLDDHSAGLAAFRGKRLVIAEELMKSSNLDEGKIKELTGGPNERITGRLFNSAEQYDYVWQAGIIMIFNENNMPKFDASDTAFIERMVIAPARSKFLAMSTLEQMQTDEIPQYTYPLDPQLESNFPLWISAFMDICTDSYDIHALDMIPQSMREWRASIADGSNPLSEWLEKYTEITDDSDMYLKLMDVRTLMKCHRMLDPTKGMDKDTVNGMIKAFFKARGVEFIENTTTRQKQHMIHLRSFFRRARLTVTKDEYKDQANDDM